MIIPPMGNKKTRRLQSILCETGRVDCNTSTIQRFGQRILTYMIPGDRGLTYDNNIQNENDETNYATASAILPAVGLGAHWSCKG